MKKLWMTSLLLILIGCARQPHPPIDGDVPGFLHGILHGVIAVFSFIASFFTDVRIYSYPNTGIWYDLGFLIGLSIGPFAAGRGGRRRSG